MTNFYLKSVNLLLETDIPKQSFPGFQQAQYLLNEAADTLKETTEKAQETLQITENISSKTSDAIQTAIASSSSQWLQDHQPVLHLVQLLIWATDHPIVSIITLVFALTITWILIKAIGRLIETATLSLLQAPLKLSQILLGVSAKSLSNFGGLVAKQFVGAKNTESLILQDSIFQPIHQNKQQRLTEISIRLEAIQKEQNELLQEAMAIIVSEQIDIGK